MKNILFTAFFSITILTLFFAPSGNNLAFAGIPNQQCLDQCAQDEFFCNLAQGPNCAAERAVCEAACPILECFTGLDCGLPSICSEFICDFGQCINVGPPNGAPCGPGDQCNEEVCIDLICQPRQIPDGIPCGDPNDTTCSNPDTCQLGICSDNDESSGTGCEADGDECTGPDVCNGIGVCEAGPPITGTPACFPVSQIGGEVISIESSALLVAGAQSFSWMIPVVLSVLGIGLFVVSRKSE